MQNQVTPYLKSDSKKIQVAQMFDSIAPRYDFLNHFLSVGIDKLWRKKTIDCLRNCMPEIILDIACGTGDLSLAALRLHPKKIYGIDISEKMLEIGKRKIEKKGLEKKIHFQEGDSEHISFESSTFDAVMVAFGVRNFEHLQQGLKEMFRVLKPNGMLAVLEFSKPTHFPIKQLYNFYFFHILPLLGKFFSKDDSAYTYLPKSVEAFPDGELFLEELQKVGFKGTKHISLTFGIASIYIAKKLE